MIFFFAVYSCFSTFLCAGTGTLTVLDGRDHYCCIAFYLLQGVSVDFPPNKLKQGFGEHALFVLDHLADAALKSTNFMWKK